jgi:hypothetical protein
MTRLQLTENLLIGIRVRSACSDDWLSRVLHHTTGSTLSMLHGVEQILPRGPLQGRHNLNSRVGMHERVVLESPPYKTHLQVVTLALMW